MPRDADLRLWDIWKACVRIIDYTQALDEAAFTASPLHQDAVVRNIEIIGEAAGHLADDVTARHPGIDWRNARAMRNVVAHSYYTVDLPTVWRTATVDVPAMEQALRADGERIEREAE